MRPYGTSTQLAKRRKRALGWLQGGQTTAQVAKRIGASERGVRRWKHPVRRSRQNQRLPGRPCRLSMSQRRRLLHALEQGAYRQGYPEDYWTLDRITHLIGDLFRIRYKPTGVWRLLQRLGWSCQKPQRQALNRDDEAIAHWKHHIWPQIKKVA